MDRAKQAVSDFMHKAGHHDTTVHEKVAPAVTRETVKPVAEEKVQKAVDREVHQDHYHTSVQPVHDRQVLPEKHKHNLLPVEHRQHEHGNGQDITRRLEQEAAQFRDESITAPTKHTTAEAPTVAGEHIHHHVHETIQPVVQRETVQPEVIHTVVPVHEVHHNAAQHHSTTALPAVSLADFKKQGGTLSGRGERYDGFEGEPRSVGTALSSEGSRQGTGSTNSHSHTNTTRSQGLTQGAGDMGHHHNITGTGGIAHQHGTTGTSGVNDGRHLGDNSGVRDTRDNAGMSGTSGTTGLSGNHHTTSKPSLLQKLNPATDTDGDGKKGIME
jgi:hypothetical protein